MDEFTRARTLALYTKLWRGSCLTHVGREGRSLRNYRDFIEYDDRWGHLHWLYQHNGGVFLLPWGKCEQWTLGVQHTVDDVDRFVHNLETLAQTLRGGGG